MSNFKGMNHLWKFVYHDNSNTIQKCYQSLSLKFNGKPKLRKQKISIPNKKELSDVFALFLSILPLVESKSSDEKYVSRFFQNTIYYLVATTLQANMPTFITTSNNNSGTYHLRPIKMQILSVGAVILILLIVRSQVILIDISSLYLLLKPTSTI